jgi:hypothetical protein
VAVLLVGGAANLVFYPRSIHWSFDFFCAVAGAVLATELPVRAGWRRVALGSAVAVFLDHHSYACLEAIGRARSPRTDVHAVRASLEDLGGAILLVDDVAARYVLDYDLPPGTVDWNFSESADRPWRPLSVDDRRPGDVWVVSEEKAMVTEGLARSDRLTLLGRTFQSIPADSREIVVVP